MKFIEIRNRYDIIEMSRKELTALVQLMKYVSERTIEQMPEPAAFDNFGDTKKQYEALKNALEQMDSNNHKTEPYPPEPKDRNNPEWKEAVLLKVNSDRAVFAISMISELSATSRHFLEFYDMLSAEDKKQIPEPDLLSKLYDNCIFMCGEALTARKVGISL